MNYKIYGGTNSTGLVKKICEHIHTQGVGDTLGEVEMTTFGDGELYCKYTQNIRGRHIFIVQSTRTSNDWMELFLMIDAAKRASAATVSVVCPYMGYMRQDRKTEPRTPISAKMVMDFLASSGVNRILMLDPHTPSIQGFTNVPLDAMYGVKAFFGMFPNGFYKDWVIVSPDLGAIKMVTKIGKKLGSKVAIVLKDRLSDTEVEHGDVLGDVKGKKCLMIDDMTMTGGTLIGAGKKLKDAGASEVRSFVTHFLGGKDTLKKIGKCPIDEFYATNTTYPMDSMTPEMAEINMVDISPLLGDGIIRTHENKSISGLFQVKGH